jgi:transitional endoplasmic reticulum ATPase
VDRPKGRRGLGGSASADAGIFAMGERRGPTTQDYLDAVADAKTTVSEAVHRDFLADIDAFGPV